jgi:hypothetical protein
MVSNILPTFNWSVLMAHSVIAVSIVRIPFLPGVVDTADPSYTVVGTALIGFTSSGVAHIAAAVPTTKALIRFCQNGFKLESKASSSHAKSSEQSGSSKRSYKSLQDNKNNSASSGKPIGTAPQLSKGSSRGTADPYGLISIGDVEEGGEFMELHQVQTHAHKDAKTTGELGGHQVTVVRECPDQELDDSSNKSILQKDSYP